MSARVGIWQVKGDGPHRLSTGDVGLEQHLEDWLERDPSMLQEGLTIVGRQLRTEAGPLDLLALDIEGRWVVIEIKSGNVRRDTVAQAIDYGSCIATMPFEELSEKVTSYLASSATTGAPSLEDMLKSRQGSIDETDGLRPVEIIVVGTGQHAGLQRMVDYLSAAADLAMSVVSFEVFATTSGDRVLVRELTEADDAVRAQQRSTRAVTLEELYAQADEGGIGREFREIYQRATHLGLHPRLWKTSIMYAPPANKRNCLVTVWTEPKRDGELSLWVSTSHFGEFYGIDQEHVAKVLGGVGWVALPKERVSAFLDELRGLIAIDGEE